MLLFTTGFGALLAVAFAAYLLGSVPFGLVVARAMGLEDPRSIGSGNIGATNVLRTGSKKAALITVLLDGAKGGISVLIARALFAEDAAIIAGLFAFLGHLYPLWLRFKGGKGVATFFGTLLALAWPIGLMAMGVWLITFLITRYSSLSALIAAFVTPPIAMLTASIGTSFSIVIMATLILLKHRDNIQRLKDGTESKFTRK